jgi:hypothetical protein
MRRLYGVLGRLDGSVPEVALRVATGCTPHAMQMIPFEQVFAGECTPFRDVHFDRAFRINGTPERRPAERQARRPGLVSLILLAEMADEIAIIRDLLEAGVRTTE